MVIGSGPIIIGQAAEFDYAGTQVCRTLKDDGIEVVLVNSNPATIMTDKTMADKVYIEPLTIPVLKKIIKLEKPDSILPTMGGQTGLTLSMQLARDGFLKEQNVRLLGADLETIDKAEDRQLFKDMLVSIGEPVIPSKVVTNIEDALDFAEEIGYPVIVRPAYTLGGTGGGIAPNKKQLIKIGENGLRLSPIHQILVEKSVAGGRKSNLRSSGQQKQYDHRLLHGKCRPGRRTYGDSIVVAPAVTLSDKEYQMLRTASINIIQALGVQGGCNCQFALNPDSFEYAVIEVNPRVSRSSALASKATGYPIAKVASKIAIGYTLDEIINSVTGKTYACFEPTLDYIVVKFPKWPFDKFVYAMRTLGTQMKATGEVMAIGTTFEQAMMKAVRCIELNLDTLNLKKLKNKDDETIEEYLYHSDDERIFVVYEALKRGISVEAINKITKIDPWFISKLKNLVDMECELANGVLTQEKYKKAKKMGFLDKTITDLSGGQQPPEKLYPAYKMVDTCAAEFAAETPYFYSTYDEENEAKEFMEQHATGKRRSSSSAPDLSASARASNSTTARSIASWR